jgi:ribosomal protein S18 acetylase RimI-like enzyme
MHEPPLRIRDFSGKDLEILCEIDRVCFPADIAFARMDFLYYIGQKGSVTRLAETSGHISGFILGRIENSRRARVITLDVVPGARRRGIGSALMEDFHHILKGNNVRAVLLEVGTGNISALRLYERMQYRCVEILPRYYNGNEDAYRMVRSI